MSLRTKDLKVFADLTIVTVDGYEPTKEYAVDEKTGYRFEVPSGAIDFPGDANWLCTEYGMSSDDLNGPGILWTDYEDETMATKRYQLTLETSRRYKSAHSSPNMALLTARRIFADLESGQWHQGGSGAAKQDLFSRSNGEREWVGKIVSRS